MQLILSAVTFHHRSPHPQKIKQMATGAQHFGAMGKVSGQLIITLCSYVS